MHEPLDSVVPAGLSGSSLPGPFPVGRYAVGLREKLRGFARVQLVGELVNLRPPTAARVYFDLRDADGAVACAMWRDDWDRLGRLTGDLVDGVKVVLAGGCDYYPGSATSSPAFSFTVSDLRVAGEGDLLAQIGRLRRRLAADGLFEPQKLLERKPLPRTIGVVCAETGKARGDILAGLDRRGWAGRLVWAFAPVQDRHAAPRIAAAVRDLAAVGGVDVIVIARGGGSLVDLMAFCDETLCRTVALLPVPVIASVGHHTDLTLIDDVAAVSCSTPTHAAEAAVPVDCRTARPALAAATRRLADHGRRAVLRRARALATLSRAPAEQVARHRVTLHQRVRELRASQRRRLESEAERNARRELVLARKGQATVVDCRQRRPHELERLGLALSAHHPERTLDRGYAVVETADGEPIQTAAVARRAIDVRLRFADGRVAAKITDG
ncbi:MAG TPA: exodeoxyribonuclease VII large subunit [Solirubrobacteraceae bacterium]|jgi:exodeoxyribonuclease VII large subunit|nr:exodeoxyribonuclease VII large subunit [Solirubrobacteraceae bacterium]